MSGKRIGVGRQSQRLLTEELADRHLQRRLAGAEEIVGDADARVDVLPVGHPTDAVLRQVVLAVRTRTVGDRRVERAGKEVTLRRKEFDILEYLARNSGRAVTRAMIFDHVWESGKDGWHNTVDVHIKHLRDKIDRPFDVPLIKTAYGIGYVLDDIMN